jgi:hypothetical protein
MQEFIDSVPLVPPSSSNTHADAARFRNSTANTTTNNNPTSLNESVINNMFNIRRNLQLAANQQRRRANINRTYNSSTITINNGRVQSYDPTETNLDVLNNIFNPSIFRSASIRNNNGASSTTTTTTTTNTSTTTTTTTINGRTVHRSDSNARPNNLSDILSTMTSDIISTMFGSSFPSSVDELVEEFPMEDVKVTLTNEQFSKLDRIPVKDCCEQTCHICMDEFSESTNKEKAVKLPCSHIFHESCIKQWLCKEKVTCPVCRADVRLAPNTRVNVHRNQS